MIVLLAGRQRTHTTTSRDGSTPVTVRFALQPGRTTEAVSPGTAKNGTSPGRGVELNQTQVWIFQEKRRTLDRMTVGLRRGPIS